MKEKIESIGKQKLILATAFIILIIIIILGGALIYNKYFYKRSYKEIEDIMKKSAESYMKKNSENLPKQINETVSLSVNDLVVAEEMKDISEYLKDESISCTGNISITNINIDLYRYVPILDCGTTYKTKKFIDYIKENIPITESGNGLYNLNEELIYRGDIVNNYLSLDGKKYRIVKFSNNETIIIYNEKTYLTNWDNRYNLEKRNTMGKNDYSVSNIRTLLNNLYSGKEKINKKDFISADAKNLLIAHNLHIGRRSETETNKNGDIEKGATIENQYIGLLPLYDYLNTSLDKNCTNSTSESCMNYNYLTDYYSKRWWTMTGESKTTYKVYSIESSPLLKAANSNAYIRPVLHLAKDTIYISGDGTLENPYVVK